MTSMRQRDVPHPKLIEHPERSDAVPELVGAFYAVEGGDLFAGDCCADVV